MHREHGDVMQCALVQNTEGCTYAFNFICIAFFSAGNLVPSHFTECVLCRYSITIFSGVGRLFMNAAAR